MQSLYIRRNCYIVGDIYDKPASAEAVSLFDEFLIALQSEPVIPVLIISGNHGFGTALLLGARLLGSHQ